MTSIQEAMSNSARLIESAENGSITPEKLTEEVTALLASNLSARGFMAALATGAIPSNPEMRLALLQGIKNGKEYAYELIVKNIVMSGCSAIEHAKNDRTDEATGSKATCASSIELAKMLGDSDIAKLAKQAHLAIEDYCSNNQTHPKSATWIAFFERWGYSKNSLQTVAPSLQSVAEML